MAERYPNIDLIGAYLPDLFGTHHSKMLVLFRHDDHAQIIIHTANMIPKDWTNMTQAVWQSPLLPLSTGAAVLSEANPIGSGNRFRTDIIRYLHSYEKRLQKLTDQLALYDFSGIRAAFLGSAPSREIIGAANPSSQTSFGWLGLQQILGRVPSKSQKALKKPPHVVLQVSSIATLGAAPTWLSQMQSVLARSYTSQQTLSMLTPKFNIIFPTAEEVRTSLDGYASGGSIHTKVQSAQQQKQLQYLHPLLCHWKSQRSSALQLPAEVRRQAHRGPAAPHIKTYVRFSDMTHKTIDWALVTSANLSKQAWGDAVNKDGVVRIQSYETGVLVWPELFASPDNNCEISMVPVFGNDVPGAEDAPVEPSGQPRSGSMDDKDEDEEETEDEDSDLDSGEEETEDEIEQDCQEMNLSHKDKGKGKASPPNTDKKHILVGFRMPYDLPLSPYDATEVPWCATQTYAEPDWKGCAWGGFQAR
jgi:tyrosyl-DNA phosphodiesterase-1